jgi:hypothetical protein
MDAGLSSSSFGGLAFALLGVLLSSSSVLMSILVIEIMVACESFSDVSMIFC